MNAAEEDAFLLGRQAGIEEVAEAITHLKLTPAKMELVKASYVAAIRAVNAKTKRVARDAVAERVS